MCSSLLLFRTRGLKPFSGRAFTSAWEITPLEARTSKTPMQSRWQLLISKSKGLSFAPRCWLRAPLLPLPRIAGRRNQWLLCHFFFFRNLNSHQYCGRVSEWEIGTHSDSSWVGILPSVVEGSGATSWFGIPEESTQILELFNITQTLRLTSPSGLCLRGIWGFD